MPSPLVLLPCLTGLLFLTLGLTLNRKRLAATPTLPPPFLHGPPLHGASPGVFVMEHFTVARFIMQDVPTWNPFPLFWTYLVGLGLLAAGLSILANRVVRLSAPMLAACSSSSSSPSTSPRRPDNDQVSWAVLRRDTAIENAHGLTQPHPSSSNRYTPPAPRTSALLLKLTCEGRKEASG